MRIICPLIFHPSCDSIVQCAAKLFFLKNYAKRQATPEAGISAKEAWQMRYTREQACLAWLAQGMLGSRRLKKLLDEYGSAEARRILAEPDFGLQPVAAAGKRVARETA